MRAGHKSFRRSIAECQSRENQSRPLNLGGLPNIIVPLDGASLANSGKYVGLVACRNGNLVVCISKNRPYATVGEKAFTHLRDLIRLVSMIIPSFSQLIGRQRDPVAMENNRTKEPIIEHRIG